MRVLVVVSGAGTRILMLAATAVTHRVVGLGLSADDYLTKPFDFAVLAELLRADGGVVSAEPLLEKAWVQHTDPFTGVVRLTITMVP